MGLPPERHPVLEPQFLTFNIEAVDEARFGVCIRAGRGRVALYNVPIQRDVVTVLKEMAQTTGRGMLEVADTPAPYEPSNHPGGRQHLSVPIDDDMAAMFRDINEAGIFEPGGEHYLGAPSHIFCYVAQFADQEGNRMTGMRRASQFKGTLRHRDRLARLVGDELRMAPDNLFRLDTEFELLIYPDEIRILNQAGFETIGQLQNEIRDAVSINIATLRQSLPFVDFDGIQAVAGGSVTAARLLANIRARGGADRVTRDSLERECIEADVNIDIDDDDRIVVDVESVIDFLDTLDRRRLVSRIVDGEREIYSAPSRRRVH